jgi:hypothetical protein
VNPAAAQVAFAWFAEPDQRSVDAPVDIEVVMNVSMQPSSRRNCQVPPGRWALAAVLVDHHRHCRKFGVLCIRAAGWWL